MINAEEWDDFQKLNPNAVLGTTLEEQVRQVCCERNVEVPDMKGPQYDPDPEKLAQVVSSLLRPVRFTNACYGSDWLFEYVQPVEKVA